MLISCAHHAGTFITNCIPFEKPEVNDQWRRGRECYELANLLVDVARPFLELGSSREDFFLGGCFSCRGMWHGFGAT